MRVIPIRGDNAGPLTGRGTNSYLLPGAAPTLIDAVEDSDVYIERVAEALDAAQPGAALAQVLVTHAHGDHIGGAPALARRWPGVRFRKIPLPERDARTGVTWTPLRDEESVAAGDSMLWVVHTPGHAPDHAVFVEIRSGILFAGDLVVNGGTVTIPVSSGGDLAAYMRSLRRVLEIAPRRIFPGHGPPVDNPGALLRAYLGHRLAREQQILDELAAGPADEATLFERVYAGLAPELHDAARENLLAHLLKLRGEGRVELDGETWRVP